MKSTFPSAKLSEIAYLNPTLGGRLPEDEVVSFVPMASVSAETAKVETTQDRPYFEVAKGFTPFLDGDILVAKITPCFENGKIAQANLPRRHGFGSTEFHVVRSRSDVSDARYLHHYLRLNGVRTEGQRRMTGSGGQRRVPASFLADLRLPVPPLEEQRRIAAILDQAETLRTQRRTALIQLDSLTQSIFIDMFGDPKTNPKNFEACRLGEVIEFVGGSQPAKEYFVSEASPDSIRLVQIRDFRTDEFKTYIPKSLARRFFETDDVMIGRYGPPVFQIFRGLSGSYNVALMKALPKQGVLRDFIFFLLKEPGLHGFVVDRSTRTAGQSGVNLELLENYPAYRPPLDLQQAFSSRIQAIETLKATHCAALAELDALFASLQQRAFSGELTPSTSPTKVLLTKARDLSELCKLNADKGLEALIYVARRMPEHHFYKSLKALYFADKHQLEHQGRLIYGETHCALPMGPVPQAAYDAAKVLSGELLVSAFDDEALRASLRRTEKELIPLRDADPQKLSAEERESLDRAIRYVAPMSFEQVKTASHDSAYERTPRNQPIQLEHIIEMLPKTAKKRFFAKS